MLQVKREVVLDTETTGLSPLEGHRLVEVGCVELLDAIPSGKTFHAYVNPMRNMPQAAFAVHGLSQDFLAQFPPFSEIVEALLLFLEDAPLVIHNACFDMKFLSAELKRLDKEAIANPIIDTLKLARTKYPGAPASLDMLCRRFQIDNTKREKHGALLDANLLASVYLELLGGKQPKLSLTTAKRNAMPKQTRQKDREPRHFPITQDEHLRHKEVLKKIKAVSWKAREKVNPSQHTP